MSGARLTVDYVFAEAYAATVRPENLKTDRKGMSAEGLGAVNVPSLRTPTPAGSTNTNQPAQVAGGMRYDYYDHIFVIPAVLEVQNPTINQLQPYTIWNAYLDPNTIASVADTGITGVTNTAVATEAFEPVQLREFGISVGPTAPVSIDVTYTYTFDEGIGEFQFIASLAVVLDIPPEERIRQTLDYATDVMRARNGDETRVAVRSNRPRQSFSYQLLITEEQARRKLRQDLFLNNLSKLVLPLWHEPFGLNTEAGTGTTTLQADFTFADMASGDNIYIEDPTGSFGELTRVDTVSASQIETANVLSNTYPVGSVVYPTVVIQPADGAGIQYYAVNAVTRDLTGTKDNDTALGGAGATVNTFQGLPVLERTPLANELVGENFDRDSTRTDFGGKFELFSGATYSNILRPLDFSIRSRADLQYWKKFLDTIYGRREPFLLSTYLEDLVMVSHAAGSNTIILDTTVDPQNWFNSQGHQNLHIIMQPGNVEVHAHVDIYTDNGDGTGTLVLEDPLPDLGASDNISRISLLELVRLGSDRVQFNHFGTYSEVTIVTETVEE